jgi:N-carbamoyl-L-amino-acid hydrolase
MHRVQRERLEKDLFNFADFGALKNGGVTRLAFTEADLKARKYLQQAMEEAGLQVHVDAFGNIRGRRAGRHDLPSVMIGSHLDTVPNGGNYDGVVGVIGALEVVRVLNDENVVTNRPIDVVNFSSEESSRFGVATLGSKVMAGKIKAETLKKLVDKDGISLYEALMRAGYAPDEIKSARIRPGEIHAFIELHIEQGPILEKEDCPTGIVTSIAAPTRLKVVVSGRSDHSGNTPMDMRQDALAGASELILGVEQIARYEAGERTVGTVGYAHVEPGAMNVVPGRVEIGIDIRDINRHDKAAAVKRVIDLMEQIANRRNLSIGCEKLSDEEPVALSGKVINCLKEMASQTKIPYKIMPSGAGHDAMNMSYITDAGMIFIPSINGISHNIAEKSHFEDICRGTELFLLAVSALAQE